MNPAHAKLVAPLTPHGEALEQIARLSCDLDDLVRENSQLRQKLHELQQRRETFEELQERAHSTARAKGFWKKDNGGSTTAEKIALIHAELSEALEVARQHTEHVNDMMRAGTALERRIAKDEPGRREDAKVPGFTEFEVELADVAIRLMDLAQARGCRLGDAIKAKMAFNETRPVKHGKGF